LKSIVKVIPFIKNKATFQLRESCRNSMIVSWLVLINTNQLTIIEFRRFDALKCGFIFINGIYFLWMSKTEGPVLCKIWPR
jgi:hypothetical protein